MHQLIAPLDKFYSSKHKGKKFSNSGKVRTDGEMKKVSPLPVRVTAIVSYLVAYKGDPLTSIFYHITDGTLGKISAQIVSAEDNLNM